MKVPMLAGAAVCAAAVWFSAPAVAATTYIYTGPSFVQCLGTFAPDCINHNLTGTFTTSLTGAALANLAYQDITATITNISFTDGMGDTLTNPVYVLVMASTDGAGDLTSWRVSVYDSLSPQHTELDTINHLNLYDYAAHTGTANPNYAVTNPNINPPGPVGTWQQAVPEPSSWALLLTGFGLIGSALRRRIGGQRLAIGASR